MVILVYIGFGMIGFIFIILLVCAIIERFTDNVTVPYDKIITICLRLSILCMILLAMACIGEIFIRVLK